MSFSTLMKTTAAQKVSQGYGDSCVSQLLSILHEINTYFNLNPSRNIYGLLVYIFKAFDGV